MYMLYYIAWFVAFAATLASIYFVEILGKPAASLCWFERMLMFGLLLTLTVGILKKDKNLKYYSLPFLLYGIPAAFFQQLVHWGIIDLSNQPCSVGMICTTKYFEVLGFATQATLCLTAFLIIALCLKVAKDRK